MPVINYIVPMCNFGEGSLVHRLRAVRATVNMLSKEPSGQITLITVEQKLNDRAPTFHENLKVPSSIKHIQKIVSYPKFNKSWLCNIGVRAAVSDNVVIAETDMYSPRPYLVKGVGFARRHALSFCFLWDKYYALGDNQTNEIISKGAVDLLPSRYHRPRRGGPEGGVVFFDKKEWEAIGGMNESFYGLGGMDNEIIYRFFVKCKRYPCFKNTLYHLYHPVSPMKKHKSRKQNKYLYKVTKHRPMIMSERMLHRKWGSENGPER